MGFYLGNDIVDFNEPETHKKFLNQRFLDRVYSALEQQTILAAENPDAVLWALWAIKEAAYKAYSKCVKNLRFSPQIFALPDFVLSNLNQRLKDFFPFTYQFSWNGQYVKCKVMPVAERVIHALILVGRRELMEWPRVVIRLRRLKECVSYQSQTIAVRQLLGNWARRQKFGDDIRVIRPFLKNAKRLGPPALYSSSRDLSHVQISLSHDGPWVGFAACLSLSTSSPQGTTRTF